MSGETWTEYGVHVEDDAIVATYSNRGVAEEHVDELVSEGWGATLVGRQVTASDWLPVQDQP